MCDTVFGNMNGHCAGSSEHSILQSCHTNSQNSRAAIEPSLYSYRHHSIVSPGLDVSSIYLRNTSPNVLTETRLRGIYPTNYYWAGENLSFPYQERYYNYLSDTQNVHVKDDSLKKRRSPSLAQRRAANIRERRRMLNLNEAFDVLRRRVPTFNYERRLSRIETLRMAMNYISFMNQILNGEDPKNAKLNFMKPVVKLEKEQQENLENHD